MAKKYITVSLGDAPRFFEGRERDFYRCVNFAALMVARGRSATGYKEIANCKINPEDLQILGIIGNPSENGVYLVNCQYEVGLGNNRKKYHLDADIYDRRLFKGNTTDIFVNKDPEYLIPDKEWQTFSKEKYDMLTDEEKRNFIKVCRRINMPARDVLNQMLLNKQIPESLQFNIEMYKKLPQPIQEWFKWKFKNGVMNAQQLLERTYEKYVVLGYD